MVKTIETLIYVVFALAGAALIIYFVINALPDVEPDPVQIRDDERGIFDVCDNASIVCALDNDGVTESNKKRCEAQPVDILCNHACPCP